MFRGTRYIMYYIVEIIEKTISSRCSKCYGVPLGPSNCFNNLTHKHKSTITEKLKYEDENTTLRGRKKRKHEDQYAKTRNTF